MRNTGIGLNPPPPCPFYLHPGLAKVFRNGGRHVNILHDKCADYYIHIITIYTAGTRAITKWLYHYLGIIIIHDLRAQTFSINKHTFHDRHHYVCHYQ